MKVIKYNLRTRVNVGSETEPEWAEILTPVELGWSEANEAIAKREAADGQYSIADDGATEQLQLSQEERISELEEALSLLLSGVTE
jgi:hypothetical protein